MLNLREAAEQAGTSKSSIFRAIKSGRLSATRDDQGGVQIDPAELARVYPPRPSGPDHAGTASPGNRGTDEKPGGTDELRVRNAALEAEVRLLREMAENLRAERDRWAAQAERLALSPPQPVRAVPAQVTPVQLQRGWWPWRRSA
jgi:hypothetical protein